MDQSLQFDAALLRKYDVSGPRYTSYPTAPHFRGSFGENAYRQAAAGSNEDPIPKPLSLYVHIPFCNTVCFYCGCNKVITANYARAKAYLDRLEQEIAWQAALFDKDRLVEQLHWGGGTPTYLHANELVRLMDAIGSHFPLDSGENREFSIEIDPRRVEAATVRLLGELGFNRLSVGVQDFDPAVQKAVNRIQSFDETRTVIETARSSGFRSVNCDLIYGLPKQSTASFATTLSQLLSLRPDRVAAYNYAHLPAQFKTQRQIREEDLPTAEQKLDLLKLTIDTLCEAGYVYIGMDHFALPDDDLTVAQRQRTLHRNFQGYSTRADCDLIGLGASAIGMVDDCYVQNHRGLDQYYDAIDAGHLPINRGVALTADDKLRRDVIRDLMCHSEVSFSAIEARHHIRFINYFKGELDSLTPLEHDGLLAIDRRSVRVLPRGRLLLRNICMAFDAYLGQDNTNNRFSRVI